MASRKEQKEQARARRLAEERARAERQRRQRRLGMLAGLVVSAAVVIVVVIAIGSGGTTNARITPHPGSVKLPAPKITGLAAAAKAAGCTIVDTPDSIARTDQNRTHVSPGTKV